MLTPFKKVVRKLALERYGVMKRELTLDYQDVKRRAEMTRLVVNDDEKSAERH